MLPGIAICICQYVTSFEANSKKFLIHFFSSSIMAIRAARNGRRATRKYVTKVRNQISFAGQKASKDQKDSSINITGWLKICWQNWTVPSKNTAHRALYMKPSFQNSTSNYLKWEFLQSWKIQRWKLNNDSLKLLLQIKQGKKPHITMCTTSSDNTHENSEHWVT